MALELCRDFSNGYLVAEILSRYWDDVSMHSYVNATSTAEKRSNWDLLSKFFHGHGINLTCETVDAIMAQQQTAVDKFLQQLYLYDLLHAVGYMRCSGCNHANSLVKMQNTASWSWLRLQICS